MSPPAQGGAIEDNSRGGTTIAVTNSMFMDNRTGAAPGNGGAIHITGNGNMNVTGGRFLRNIASREGGGCALLEWIRYYECDSSDDF